MGPLLHAELTRLNAAEASSPMCLRTRPDAASARACRTFRAHRWGVQAVLARQPAVAMLLTSRQLGMKQGAASQVGQIQRQPQFPDLEIQTVLRGITSLTLSFRMLR